MTYLNTTEKFKVENYPYGYVLKTDKFYSIEFKSMKGFRIVEQTLNPKTGQLNKPKKSTYSPLGILKVEEGRVKYHTEDFYNDAGKNKGYKFVFDNYNHFTIEEIKGMALYNIMLLKADIYSKVNYCGSDQNKMFPLYSDAVDALVEIAKTGANLWDKVVIDWNAVDALKVPNYNPFKVVTHQIIN